LQIFLKHASPKKIVDIDFVFLYFDRAKTKIVTTVVVFQLMTPVGGVRAASNTVMSTWNDLLLISTVPVLKKMLSA